MYVRPSILPILVLPDDALRLTPPTVLSLEQAIDFIDTDELLEVTPESLRIRKKILDPKMRKRVNR